MIHSDCPHCGCSEIKLATQVYGSGSAASGHHQSSDRHSRTARPLATENIAPPSAPSNLLSWLVSLLAFLVCWVMVVRTIPLVNESLLDGGALETFFTISPYVPIVTGLVLSCCVYRLVRGSYDNKRKLYETNMRWWEKTWLCMSCGGTWMH